MKLFKSWVFLLAIILVLPLLATASEFKLKNVPEKFASLEGAIVEETEQSIIILTKSYLLTRSIETVEVVKRTPEEDKKFIEEYGPSVPLYQEYLRRKNNESPSSDSPRTSTATSSSVPKDKKVLLRYQFTEGETAYIVSNTTNTVSNQLGDRNFDTKSLVNHVIKLAVKHVDEQNQTTIQTNYEKFETEISLGRRAGQKMDLLKQLGEMQKTYHVDPQGNFKIISREELKRANPMLGMEGQSSEMSFLLPFPEDIVTIGDTWKGDQPLPIPGIEDDVIINIQSELSDIVNRNGELIAIINSKQTIDIHDVSFDPAVAAGENLPENAKIPKMTINEYNLDSNVEYGFSLSRKMMRYVNTTGKAVIDMETGGQRNMKTIMNIDGTARITLEKPNY